MILTSQNKTNLFSIHSLYSLMTLQVFIDLDSYSLVLEKDKSRNLFTTGGGVDINVQVVNRKSNCAISVLFCGTRCYPENSTLEKRKLAGNLWI